MKPPLVMRRKQPLAPWRHRCGLKYVAADVDPKVVAGLEAAYPDVPRTEIVRLALAELLKQIGENDNGEQMPPAA
jgi:hypothetical protein